MPDKFEVWKRGPSLHPLFWFFYASGVYSDMTQQMKWFIYVRGIWFICPSGPIDNIWKGQDPTKTYFFRGWLDKPVLSHSKWAVKFLFFLRAESVSLVASHSSRRNGLFLLRRNWLLAVIFWLNTNEKRGSQDGCEKFQIWQVNNPAALQGYVRLNLWAKPRIWTILK